MVGMGAPESIPLSFTSFPEAEMRARAAAWLEHASKRRTVRDYKPDPIPREVLESCLRAAGSAPSGANQQPWTFVVVQDSDLKQRIRVAAEAEERRFYEERAPDEWLEALAPIGTDAHKPFLETAPALIAVFAQRFGEHEDGRRRKHYYVDESVGLATGMLIAGLHHAGLATLTHTPSPMGFLRDILERPESERAFLLLVVGYPAEDARVPAIERKALEDIAIFK